MGRDWRNTDRKLAKSSAGTKPFKDEKGLKSSVCSQLHRAMDRHRLEAIDPNLRCSIQDGKEVAGKLLDFRRTIKRFEA